MRDINEWLLCAATAVALGCASPGTADETGDRGDEAAACPVFEEPEELGLLDTEHAKEISGIAVSRRNDDVIWAQNDGGSGDRNLVLAFAPSGELLGTWQLDVAENEDWEDLAFGPGPRSGRAYLYVADIGDKTLERKEIQFFRFEEPKVVADDTDQGGDIDGSDIERIELEYDDGGPHNAEAMVIDPLTGDVYVITKRTDDDRDTIVFRAQPPFHATKDNALQEVIESDQEKDLRGTVVAADVTPDGERVVLLFKEGHTRMWVRDPDQPLWTALEGDGCKGPSAPGQQEAIAFAPDGMSYFLVPEGEEPPVVFVGAAPR